jgi:hypothetical protein
MFIGQQLVEVEIIRALEYIGRGHGNRFSVDGSVAGQRYITRGRASMPV